MKNSEEEEVEDNFKPIIIENLQYFVFESALKEFSIHLEYILKFYNIPTLSLRALERIRAVSFEVYGARRRRSMGMDNVLHIIMNNDFMIFSLLLLLLLLLVFFGFVLSALASPVQFYFHPHKTELVKREMERVARCHPREASSTSGIRLMGQASLGRTSKCL